MSWIAYSVKTITGGDRTEIPVESFDWARALSAGCTGKCVVPLGQMVEYTAEQRRLLTLPWDRTIVLEYAGEVVFAGIIRAFEVAGRRLTLHLTDLWGLWARRGAWDHSAPLVIEWEHTYEDLDLGTLAKRAVMRGTDGPPVPNLSLPIGLPADGSGDLTRTYYGYHLEFVADVLEDLMDEGLNIDFRPRWWSGALQWELRNNPGENVWDWHVNAPLGGVSDFREEVDGSRITNNARYVGEGSDTDMLIRSQRNEDSTLPLLDRTEFRKHISDTGQLSALAGEALVKYAPPTRTYTFEVLASGSPTLGEIRLGDTARLWFSDDLWNADGKYDRTIVRLEGSIGERVTVHCQPTGGE